MPQITEKIILIDPDKCTGCHRCEIACSIKHFGVCSPSYSRIKIHEFLDVNTFIPVTCQACEDAICINVCPMNARVRQASGTVVTDEERCVGCRGCIYACPFGASMVNPETGKTMSCDRCVDDESGPWCVRACKMHKAITFVKANDAAGARGREWARRLKDVCGVPSVIKIR